MPDAAPDAETIDSFFPLWKSLLKGRKFMPPRGITVVLVDLSGEWDVQSFSASVGGNQLASVSGTASSLLEALATSAPPLPLGSAGRRSARARPKSAT